jgi:hypothetical protein
MRKIIFIILTIISSSCNFNEYKVTSLEHKELNFIELPYEVKNYLTNPKDRIGDSYKILVILSLSDSANYSVETVGTFIGPWINYHKLTDKQKNISYRINRGVPSPCILFNNKLYIADRYSILGRESAFEAKYTEYQLK